MTLHADTTATPADALGASQRPSDPSARTGRPGPLAAPPPGLKIRLRGELYDDDRLPEPPEPQTSEPGRGRRRSSNPEATRRLSDVDVSAIKRLLMGQEVAPGVADEPLTQAEVCERANLSPALVAQIASTRRGAAVTPMRSFGKAMQWLERTEWQQDPVRHDLIRSMRESPNVGKTGRTTAASRERYFDGSRMRRLPQRFVSKGHALGGRGGRVAAIAGQGFRVDGESSSPMRTERTAADPYAGALTLRTAEDFTLAGLGADITVDAA